tara:strand:- start:1501 stop:1734 length:234 start_codon:yes stop_codon:yes gene_type:complete
MTELSEDVVLLLKELVSRVQELEKVAYHDDNVLMKSGLVVTNSPTPSMNNKVNSTFSMDDVANMSFDDMAKIISKME